MRFSLSGRTQYLIPDPSSVPRWISVTSAPFLQSSRAASTAEFCAPMTATFRLQKG